MTTSHFCDPKLHDGAKVPADWLVLQAVDVEPGAAEQSLSAALVPSAGSGTTFAACVDHIVVALDSFGTGKFIVRELDYDDDDE